MVIGTRTIAAVALLAGSLFLLWNQGRFRPDYLAQLDPWVTLTAACFAVITGTAAYRFLQLHERSGFGIGIFKAEPILDADGLPVESQKRGLVVFGRLPSTGAIELPPFALLLVTVLVCLSVGLMTLNNRAIALINFTTFFRSPTKRNHWFYVCKTHLISNFFYRFAFKPKCRFEFFIVIS